MRRVTAAVVLVITWLLLTGEFTLISLLLGILVAAVALIVVRFPETQSVSRLRLIGLGPFLAWYVWMVAKSNLIVATETLRPSPKRHAAVVRVPVTSLNTWEVVMLMNLVTFTPGTIAVDVSDDERSIYVHGLYLQDPDEIVRDVQDMGRRLEGLRR
jgi:multicomponent Na+:H+ antiporter subunit E